MSYLRPDSLEQLKRLLSANPNAKILAGGQSLLPAMRLGLAAPEQLLDLQDIDELKAIEQTSNGIRIAAMCTHHSIASSALVRDEFSWLADVAQGIGDQQIRHCGTIGGSLANNDPAACWPCAALAANATIVTTQRRICADDYFVDLFATALNSDEVITHIEFQRQAQARYKKIPQPASRFALVGCAIALQANDGQSNNKQSHAVRVALTGLGAGVTRWADAEMALTQDASSRAIQQLQLPLENVYSDLHATARYRAHLAKHLTSQLLDSMRAL
jgi:aerobic carbon-monoxide dehydrogenase medium subunit